MLWGPLPPEQSLPSPHFRTNEKPHMGWQQLAPQRSSGPVAVTVLGSVRLPVPSHARIAGKGASPNSCAVCKIQPAGAGVRTLKDRIHPKLLAPWSLI